LHTASRRFVQPGDPVRQVNLTGAKLFLTDINFIKDMGEHPRTIVREAVHIYCDALRTARPLKAMTRQERDEFVLGKLPGMKHTRKPARTRHKMIKRPEQIRDEHIAPPSMIMRTWSKEQRDAYILQGTVP
jgi:hypothetical protein